MGMQHSLHTIDGYDVLSTEEVLTQTMGSRDLASFWDEQRIPDRVLDSAATPEPSSSLGLALLVTPRPPSLIAQCTSLPTSVRVVFLVCLAPGRSHSPTFDSWCRNGAPFSSLVVQIHPQHSNILEVQPDIWKNAAREYGRLQ